MNRTAYLISSSQQRFLARQATARAVLEKVGFSVVVVEFIPHARPAISNKLTHQHILEQVLASNDTYAYVFEDDVNVAEAITLDEIIQYEAFNSRWFCLGICEYSGSVPEVHETCTYGGLNGKYAGHIINNHPVLSMSGWFRGSHAYAVSQKGAQELLDFSKAMDHDYFDVQMEAFSVTHPVPVVRYDIDRKNNGHRGIFFQDRDAFPVSTVYIPGK